MNTKIKILFLAANPKDTNRIRLDEEIRVIDQAIRQTEFRQAFEIKQHWAVRVADIQGYLLRYQPHIVHFSGHGSRENEIMLEDKNGASHPVSKGAWSQLFSVLKDNIRCVVLNACYSQGQAEAIAQHADCVIGMSRAIGDSAAISFSAAFYQALGYGRDIKTAFELGCLQIDMENLNEQDTPKLFANNCNPEQIVLVNELDAATQNNPASPLGSDENNAPAVHQNRKGGVHISSDSAHISGDIAGHDLTHIHGDVVIGASKSDKKNWVTSTQAKLTIIITLLGIIGVLFILKDRLMDTAPVSRFQSRVIDVQTNSGIADVTVVLTEIDGMHVADTTKTAADGSFIVKVKAQPGSKIRLHFHHPQYKPYNNYYETENPSVIKLEKDPK